MENKIINSLILSINLCNGGECKACNNLIKVAFELFEKEIIKDQKEKSIKSIEENIDSKFMLPQIKKSIMDS